MLLRVELRATAMLYDGASFTCFSADTPYIHAQCCMASLMSPKTILAAAHASEACSRRHLLQTSGGWQGGEEGARLVVECQNNLAFLVDHKCLSAWQKAQEVALAAPHLTPCSASN